MEPRQAPDYDKAGQNLADIHEDLELKRWRILYPAHGHMLRVVSEAARRAESLARLERALTQLR
jgi:glyoxylase-like metal-dependent hydrolase (beta-lactamase superfamily II)